MYLINYAVAVSFICVLSCGSSVQADEQPPAVAAHDYQQRLLLDPTPSQLAAEENGRVHIFDSLEMSVVDKALDQQFNRIGSMMFVRIHHLPPAGAGPAEVENDGCD